MTLAATDINNALAAPDDGADAASFERDRPLRDEIETQIKDAQHERGKYEHQFDENLRLFLGETEPSGRKSDGRWMSVNRILHAVETHVGVITESPVEIIIDPVENDEPADWFLLPQGTEKLEQSGVQVPIDPNQPMRELDVVQLIQQTSQSQVVEQPAGQDELGNEVSEPVQTEVPILDPDADFIAVDDKLTADAMTLVHSNLWRRDDGDAWLLDHVRQAVIHGYADALTQWIPDEERFSLETLHPKLVWIDRFADTPQRHSEYMVIEQVFGIDEAIRAFPDVPPETIREQVNQDTNTSNIAGTTLPDRFTPSTDREIVSVVQRWQRNAQFPMTEQEAVEAGVIEPATEQASETVVDEATGLPSERPVETPVTDELGQQVYLLAETGEPTIPGADNWPTRNGLRQSVLLGDLVLFDGESEFADIPIGRSRYKPIPQTAYGVGLPCIMWPMQELWDRLWTIYHKYIARYQHPETVMPVSVANELKSQLGNLYSAGAFRQIAIPDHTLARVGGNINNAIQRLDPPQLSTVAISMLQQVGEELDRVGGVSDVLRGEFKSDTAVGVFEQATSAARGPIGLVARNVASTIRHLTRLNVNLIAEFMTDEEFQKHTKKYPIPVIRSMRERLKRVGFDLKVTIAGAGTEEQRLLNLTNLIGSIPTLTNSPTFMEHALAEHKLPNANQIVQEMFQAQQPAPDQESGEEQDQ